MAEPTSVRLHPLLLGWMTADASGMVRGDTGTCRIPVPGYLVEHPDGLVMIDAGVHPAAMASTDRLRAMAGFFTLEMDPERDGVAAVLGRAGARPGDVALLVLTHLHFDHAGGIGDLPDARLVVQASEWASRHDERALRRGVFDEGLPDAGHDVQTVDGDHDLFGDGTVVLLSTPGHTPGHQSVRVQTETGTQLVCGDCCYFGRTLDDGVLPPSAHDHAMQTASLNRLRAEVAAGARPWFGHDPAQWGS